MEMSWHAWAVTLAAVLAASGTARLGVWQLDRAAQKLALQSAIDNQRSKPPLEQRELPARPADVTAAVERRAVVEGRWRGDATVLLDNRPLDGSTGFIVVTPLLLADGRAVAVQRGWLPRHAHDRTRIAPFETPAGPVRVEGRIAASPSRAFELGPAASGVIRQNLDLDAWARERRLNLLPFAIVQDGDGAADGLVRRRPAPTAGVDTHYGYAFQWFALSGLVIVLYVWFRIVRPRRHRA
jgi:surfeit locus 1 family protein